MERWESQAKWTIGGLEMADFVVQTATLAVSKATVQHIFAKHLSHLTVPPLRTDKGEHCVIEMANKLLSIDCLSINWRKQNNFFEE